MMKHRLTQILTRASSEEVRSLSAWIAERHEVTVVREPGKSLVMIPMVEPVTGTAFYLGELLTCEATVQVAGARGVGVCMGDDFDKVLAMAVIDAAFNAKLEECPWLTDRLSAMEYAQKEQMKRDAALHARTKVAFRTMEGA